MPDHIHLVLTPAYKVSLEKAMQFVKGGFSFRLKSRAEVWQRSFMEHRIRDPEDMRRHVEYVEHNPVRAGLAEEPEAFPFSSACRKDRIDGWPPHLGR